jgi:hypothetical protein
MPEQLLFGGSIVCHIPAAWKDIAEIRQVPDHQECWQDAYDRLLVVEIVDRQSQVDDAVAANFFYKDLAESNGITSDQDVSFTQQPAPLQLAGLPNDTTLCCGTGLQRVAMGKEVDIAGNPRRQEVRWIRVELCVIRLPSVGTDLVITLSSPSEPNPQETTAGPPPTEIFTQILSTFQIRDWSLFG